MNATAPKPMRAVLRIGDRFSPVGETYRKADYGITWRWLHSKPDRRMMRRRVIKQSSRIERSIAKARKLRMDSEALATNSHEAKRYVEAERQARRGTTHATPG